MLNVAHALAQLVEDDTAPLDQEPSALCQLDAPRRAALFLPQYRGLTAELERENTVTSAKARRTLGFSPRPAQATLADCAESLAPSARTPHDTARVTRILGIC